MKIKYIPILCSIVLVLGIILGKSFSKSSSIPMDNHKLSSFNYLVDEIDNHYVDSLDWSSLEEALIERTLEELDPHSYYIPPVDLIDVNDKLNGHFGGIGVHFRVIEDTITILNTLKDGPARKAGLILGDQIIGANGKIKSETFTNDSILNNLKGYVGGSTSISFKRKNEIFKKQITRAEIPIESISSFFPLAEKHYYIRLNRFSHRSYNEFADSINSLQESFRKLTIDLRDNGGGSLQNAVDIAKLFLHKGDLITYTEGDNQERKEYKAENDGPFTDVAVDIWVNENSASASEILSGALQYHKKARIIGRNTFGKGLVQQQFDLPNTGGFRLVVAKYFTPSGICIQRPYKDKKEEDYYGVLNDSIDYGIHPDIEIPLDTTLDFRHINQIYTLDFLNSILFYTVKERKALIQIEIDKLMSHKEELLEKLISDENLENWERDYISVLITAEISDLLYGNNIASKLRLTNDQYLEFIKNSESKH